MNHDGLKSVLIIHPGGLGDVLLSLPAITSIRSHNLGRRIVLLAGSNVGNLLQACGMVDQTLTTESGDLASLIGGTDQVSLSLRSLLQSCDCVVGWLKDSDGALQTTLRQLGIKRIALGTPTPQEGVHQSKRFFHILEEEQDGYATAAHLIVPDRLRQAGADVLRMVGIGEEQAIVVCHPGSGSIHKCVRPETMTAVMRNFRQGGVMPVIVGGPADDETVRRVRERGLQDFPVIQCQNLTTIAGVVAQARLFVGHDSGLTHLAAALQIPTVAIFGPTDPRQWAPQGAHVSVVTGPPCACFDWAQVRACDKKPCLAVSVEDVMAASFSALSCYRAVTKS